MFDTEYPHLTAWIFRGDAWIELGQDERVIPPFSSGQP